MGNNEQLNTKKRGRPKGTGKINQTVIDALCKGIENGLTYEGACMFASIPVRTFYRWKKDGQEAKSGIYLHFWQSLSNADLTARNKIEITLMKCAIGYDMVKEREVIDKTTGAIVTLQERWREIDTATLRFVAARRYPKDWGNKIHIAASNRPLKVTLFGAVGMGTHGKIDEK